MLKKNVFSRVCSTLCKLTIVPCNTFWRGIRVDYYAVNAVRICEIVTNGSDVLRIVEIVDIDIRLVETEEYWIMCKTLCYDL